MYSLFPLLAVFLPCDVLHSASMPSQGARTVAYVQCAKGGGPWGLDDEVPRSWRFYVNECLNFNVLEEKTYLNGKNTIIKI